jgi:hypothetical protein
LATVPPAPNSESSGWAVITMTRWILSAMDGPPRRVQSTLRDAGVRRLAGRHAAGWRRRYGGPAGISGRA